LTGLLRFPLPLSQKGKIMSPQSSRILSANQSANGAEFWIITEADRSITTFLLPEDY
jgi:hypothetical protein